MDRFELIDLLARVEALEDQGATAGERAAAASARRRLAARLAELPPAAAEPPSAHAAELVERGFDLVQRHAVHVRQRKPLTLPSAASIVRRLRRWQRGDLSTDGLRGWAARFVDRLVMPDHHPSDPRSIPVEVMLQLADPRGLQPHDASEVIRFLESPPEEALAAWREWLAFLAAVHGQPA